MLAKAIGVLSLALLCLAAPDSLRAQTTASPEQMRELMIESIQQDAYGSSLVTGIESIDPTIVEVLREVPRHLFLPEPLQPYGYNNHPLPLGYGQNIASPFLVALMTQLAAVEKDDVVFETGTGSGYHAAVLSGLADRIYSVEVVPPLAEQAAQTLADLGYDRVFTRQGDGYYGWPEQGPYDAIIVKESLDHVPPPLISQLKPGGRMVIPLGPVIGPQYLTVVRKGLEGQLTRRRVLPVQFSPLQGGERT